MSFDLEKHLRNHAWFFKKYREIGNDIHFNVSFIDLDFIGQVKERKEQRLMDLLKELREPRKYREPNGRPDGKQVWAKRTIDLEKSISVEAIHFEDPEGNDTMPHIHFMLEKNGRYGHKFSLLKKHISLIAEKYGLTPNFDEMVEHNPLGVKNLSKATNALTWSWKKMTNTELRKSIETRGIDNAVKILTDYSLKTNNLTYYFKSMEGLKKRLNRMKLDIELDGHNLRNTYPIPLTESDLTVVKLISEKRFNQKDMKPHLKSPILRDFIRHSAKTTRPYIINALKEQTSLLDGVKRNQRAVENYVKLSKKTPVLKKSRLTKTDNKALSVKNDLGANLKLAAQSASNEKELRALMQEAGYEGFGLKKTKGSVSGCFYLENEKKRVFKFIDINVNWSQIKKKLMENTRKQDNGEELEKKELHKRDLKPFEDPSLPLPFPETPKTVKIESKSKEIEEKKEKAKEKSKLRRLSDGVRNGIQKLGNKIAEIKIWGKEKALELIEEIRSYQEQSVRAESEIEKLEADISTASETVARFGEIETQIIDIERGISTAQDRERELRAEIGEIESPSFVEFRIASSRERNAELRAEIEGIETRASLVSVLDQAHTSNQQKREAKKPEPTEPTISPKR